MILRPTDDGTHSTWFDEHHIEILLQNPFIQHRIARYASPNSRPATYGESINHLGAGPPDFLSFTLVTAHRIASRLSTSRPHWVAEQQYQLPIGRVIVGTLCSLASRGQELLDFTQQADGCTLLAKRTFRLLRVTGEFVVDIRRGSGADRTSVAVGIQLPGLRPHRDRSVRRDVRTLFEGISHFTSLDDHL
jgi:hypothetical protein